MPGAKSQQSAPRYKRLRIVAGAFVVVFLLCLVAITTVGYHVIYDSLLGLSYRPGAEMRQIISDIKLTDKGERIVKASAAELQDADSFNRNCPNATAETSVLGCYYNWKIYVYDINNAELNGIKEAVLAHEVLHAVWQREHWWIKDELEPILRNVYWQNRADLAEHMETYSEEDLVDELHSVIGTQIDPQKLPQRLREHYRSIFRDHAQIVAYFNQYNDKFVQLKREMDEMTAAIDEMKSEIDKLTAKYEANSRKLSEDISTFNRRAADNYYVDKQKFDADRAALVSRQEALNREYEELSDLVDEANAKIDEYNQKAIRTSELYKSINSNVEKVKSVDK